MKHVLILISCSFILLSQKQSDIKYVEINQSDVENLGGWPLDRKWYGIAIDHLIQAGASEIYIDISFPNADAFHPESDQYFFQKLNEGIVYLLSENRDESDSIRLLGHLKYPMSKTFKALNNFKIEAGVLEISDISNSMISNWLDMNTPSNFYLNLADEEPPVSDYHFTELVKAANLDVADQRVLISLNLTGYSSYIAGLYDQKLVSSSELNLLIYRQLIKNQFYYMPHMIHYLLQFFLISTILLLRIRNKHNYDIQIVISSILITIVLFLSDYLVDWFLMTAPALIILISVFSRMQKSNQVSNDPELKAEIQRLRKKLSYLESNSVKGERLVSYEELKQSGIICHPSSPLVSLYEKAKVVAQSNIPVMIYGESGTGKEGLAQFIHSESVRKTKPFIAINCGAITETLIESEIFGHEAGSFTGANKQKIGKFELANNGTIFLDEIAETSEAFQIKLLRVLQEGRFERLGGNEPVQVSVRVITASHQDIANSDRFRKDLFYRLNGIQLKIPSLKERRVDVGPLTHYYRKFYDPKNEIQLSDQLVQWLEAQNWPGNVRQLMSSIERACINCKLAKRNQLIPEDFEIENSVEVETVYTEKKNRDHTADSILDSLRQKQFSHKSVSEVADLLSIHRITVTEYLRAWIIHYMNLENMDSEQIYRGLKGPIEIHQEEKFRQRVDNYISSIKEKILSSKSNEFENIQSELFKNLPASFHSDLNLLIKKLRQE